ncbi:MAG: HEAT repeat domain-containing protein [Nitrososphaerota archaeon]|nr:HEAT repeat domain-containing protein [Nitrososphaerota archaeon]
MSFSEEEYYLSSIGKGFVRPDFIEQYARDRNFLIEHVRLEGELDYGSKSLRATMILRVRNINENKIVELDAVNLDINRIVINGECAHYSYDGKKLLIRLPSQVSNAEVGIEYEVIEPKRGLFLITPNDDHPDWPYMAWTQGECQHNRYWIPIYDYPNMKFTSEIILTVPENQSVVANGVLQEVSESNGKKRYHWLMDKPHSSYLIAFYAGEFDSKNDLLDDSIRLYYFVPKGRGGDIDRSFSKTPDIMRFFSEFTGLRYPYEQYSQTCVLSPMRRGAMENITAARFPERQLHDEIAHIDFTSNDVVAHELAHQWFGCLVTCKDWSHTWLNEGFATFFQALYFRHDAGCEEFHYDLITKMDAYLEEASKKYVRPIVTKLYSAPEEMYDAHTYRKGALVLNSLMNLIGESNFRKGVKTYLERFKFSNAETDDFRKSIEETTNKSLEWFFDQWIYRSGHPDLKFSYSYDPIEKTVTIKAEQRQQERPLRIPITIIFRKDSAVVTNKIILSHRNESFIFDLEERPDFVCFDPDISAPGSLEVEEDTTSQIIKARGDDHVYCRILAIRSMTKSPSRKTIEALGSILVTEGFWALSAEAAKALGKIRTKGALDQLLKGSNHPHPKARKAVANTLGEFKDRSAFETLETMWRTDTSYYVKAAALASLGKIKNPESYDILVGAINVQSHDDVIASSAILGMGDLKLDKCLPLLLECTSPSTTHVIRRAAAMALGSYTHDNRAKEKLEELLWDEDLEVSINAVCAMERSEDISFIGVLNKIVHTDIDGKLMRRAIDASKKLTEQSRASKQMADDFCRLEQENRMLKEKLHSTNSG